jgi:thiol-disulfide isomerase/thioredoxin
MKNLKQILILVILVYFVLLGFGIYTYTSPTFIQNHQIVDGSNVTVKFFYAQDCDHCEEKRPMINQIEQIYADNISVYYLNYHEHRSEFYSYGFTGTPGLVIYNLTDTTTFNYSSMSFENVNATIDAYLKGKGVEIIEEDINYIIDTPFGVIDISDYSLPVLTIVLGAIDSINPCSFFILLVLLSLLLYAKSQKKMILIGSIFIFFSGLIYFILMVLLLTTVKIVDQPFLISLIAGVAAVILGVVNIKDFFYFKSGVSLSISKENKKKLFRQMRNIIRLEYLPAMIAGTIILAITANTYELACTLGFPVVFTEFLILYEIPITQAYMYIFLYNLIYVIPLVLIVSIFVITLGKRKLSEAQGRTLKLISGLMMFSFGMVFLINASVLRNIFAAFVLLLGSIILSIAVSFIWKRYGEFKNKS